MWNRDAVPHCWGENSCRQSVIEVKAAKTAEKNNIFFKYINGKKQFRNDITLFQDEDGHLTNRDKAKVFNAFF